jgi:hypothetical protein
MDGRGDREGGQRAGGAGGDRRGVRVTAQATARAATGPQRRRIKGNRHRPRPGQELSRQWRRGAGTGGGGNTDGIGPRTALTVPVVPDPHRQSRARRRRRQRGLCGPGVPVAATALARHGEVQPGIEPPARQATARQLGPARSRPYGDIKIAGKE